MVASDFVHGPSGICRAAMLSGKNDSAETGFGETIILWCTNATGITPTTIILAEISVFGG
jgi:hypothetical protein